MTQRVQNGHQPINDDIIDKTDREAMRAYLARCEVRISTLHRIALGFINGAGLLVLFPIFFKDVINVIITTFLHQAVNQFPGSGNAGIFLSGLLWVCLLYPFLLSVGIPIYALYLVLKDIIHFYYTVYSPGFPSSLNNPTFSLSGIAFSPDESPRVKRLVMQEQYRAGSNLMNFAMPFSARRQEEFFDQFIEETHHEVIPSSRTLEHLKAMGVLSPGEDQEKYLQQVERMNTEFGLARMLDRQLVEEVAITEVMLTRCVQYLRRLIFRYAKTLLVFIWTTIVSFLMVPFLQDARFSPLLVLSSGYVVWSVLVLQIIHSPISWLYRFNPELHGTAHLDRQIVLVETNVKRWVYVAIGSSFMAFMLVIGLHFIE